jgi:PadR family transcriptional regulator, regulatory protein PadR
MTDVEMLILNALDISGGTHPYRLARDVEERNGNRTVSLGALYKALHRFENRGYVQSHWEDVDPSVVGRPKRRIYKITGVGEAALSESVKVRSALFARILPEGST